jgi:hypothetical protein
MRPMGGNVPFLLAYGHAVGLLLLVLVVAAGAGWGPKLRAKLKRIPLEPSTPRTRIKHALVTTVVALVVSSGFGWLGLWLATKSPTLGLRWTGVFGASVTPFRGKALDAAQELLAMELVSAFPEDDVSQFYRTPLGLGDREAARYVALSRLRNDCEKSPDQLVSFAVTRADLSERAAERSLECKRPLDLSRLAEARFWEGDFSSASSLFDRAKIVWGETDKEQMYAQNLVIMRGKKEIFTHWLAGRFDAAGRSIDRLPKYHADRFACVRHVMAVIANEPDALAKLRENSRKCPVHLANLDPARRKELLGSNQQEHDNYLYQSWAMDLEPLLSRGVTFKQASLGSSPAQIEAPHELLSFPTGARRLDAAIVKELLARVEADKNPTPARRLVRARLAASAATTESLFAEHAVARRFAKLVRGDFGALVALPIDDKAEDGVSSYHKDRLELESRYAGILEAAIELRAGNVEAAERVLNEIPALKHDEKTSGLVESEVARMRASAELVRAFTQLWRGKTEDLRNFANSEACKALSGCFIVRGDVEKLAAATRGEVAFCEETACLVGSRRADTRERLIARLDDFAGIAAVSDEPLGRLYRIGQARALAQAVGEPERIARFDRWFRVAAPIALDPRLAVARKNLEHIN